MKYFLIFFFPCRVQSLTHCFFHQIQLDWAEWLAGLVSCLVNCSSQKTLILLAAAPSPSHNHVWQSLRPEGHHFQKICDFFLLFFVVGITESKNKNYDFFCCGVCVFFSFLYLWFKGSCKSIIFIDCKIQWSKMIFHFKCSFYFIIHWSWSWLCE